MFDTFSIDDFCLHEAIYKGRTSQVGEILHRIRGRWEIEDSGHDIVSMHKGMHTLCCLCSNNGWHSPMFHVFFYHVL